MPHVPDKQLRHRAPSDTARGFRATGSPVVTAGTGREIGLPWLELLVDEPTTFKASQHEPDTARKRKSNVITPDGVLQQAAEDWDAQHGEQEGKVDAAVFGSPRHDR